MVSAADPLAIERRVEAALVAFFEREARMPVRRFVEGKTLQGKEGSVGVDPFVEFDDDRGEGEINLAAMAAFLVEELKL